MTDMLDRRNQSEVAWQVHAIDPNQVPDTSNKRILVVDDEPMIRRLIDRVLTLEGHSVDLAEDGQTAWLMLQDKRYDCVILDWRMPGMNGNELYQLIEGSYSDLASRCLFISGHATTPAVEEFALANGIPILLKPFSIDKLRGAVSNLVGVNQPQQ